MYNRASIYEKNFTGNRNFGSDFKTSYETCFDVLSLIFFMEARISESYFKA